MNTIPRLLLMAPDTASSSIWNLKTGEDLFVVSVLLIILAGCAILAVATLHLYLSVRPLIQPADAAKEKRTFWQSLTGLKPLSQERELMMEHAYDGISELDNPTPPWFMYLFYSTIGFAAIYLLVFHVIGTGNIMEQEYTQEVAIAEKQREEYIKKVAGSINENTVTLLKDTKSVESGKVLYDQYCTACHGANAEGKVGPNLTDEYWLHGGDVKAVFHTVTEGVPEKGMISWKKQLNPLQIQQVTSYVLSLQGTNPLGAKEPQGEKQTTGTPVAMR
ncbi:cb-type cytochrome c oxidase subunit III [Fibrisoma limi BUZ 3]|uniref:Cb-type cytochrome c oxidase subunit III n=1 Tax=Fibrisoma limi BUZ 3 TaxID=1185876 RepID=I2GIS9_9BACT|nr:cbb3-type cytochrome c oxidase N-terminal domain-containing protein [Fibrisoma limi]CCH53804.1 cb-type cytochrome c oxidase subunit III [Fibrisoma limi BUZ 3]